MAKQRGPAYDPLDEPLKEHVSFMVQSSLKLRLQKAQRARRFRKESTYIRWLLQQAIEIEERGDLAVTPEAVSA